MKGLKIFFAVTVILILFGCRREEEVLRIAEQWGLAYFPLQIIKEQELLAEYLPGTEVKWIKLNNAAAIREAMIADKLDVGFMGVPPFLIGADKGMEWEIFTGLSRAPLGLVVSDPDIRDLSDFTKEDRIALPQPGSIQHILLSMACEDRLGDPKALDRILVTMSHPDGMNALMAGGDVTGHFTSPPYLFQELKLPGFRKIISGREAFGGDFTFIVGVVDADFRLSNDKTVNGLVKALNAAVEFIEEDRAASTRIGSRLYNIPVDEMAEYLADPEMKFSTEVLGVDTFTKFMKGQRYLSGN